MTFTLFLMRTYLSLKNYEVVESCGVERKGLGNVIKNNHSINKVTRCRAANKL